MSNFVILKIVVFIGVVILMYFCEVDAMEAKMLRFLKMFNERSDAEVIQFVKKNRWLFVSFDPDILEIENLLEVIARKIHNDPDGVIWYKRGVAQRLAVYYRKRGNEASALDAEEMLHNL